MISTKAKEQMAKQFPEWFAKIEYGEHLTKFLIANKQAIFAKEKDLK